MIKKYKINENECGYLIRRGRFEKLLTVGTYYFLSLSGCEVKIVPMTGAVNTCGIPEEILMKNPEFASRVVKNVLPDTSIAIRFVNGAFREVVCKPETLFWNVFEKNEFQVIDITKPWMEETLPRMYMELMPAKYYKKIVIKDGETGLLYFDNQFERQLEISGQEILTADKVGVRLNVICTYRITDPRRLVMLMENVGTQLYTHAQLILREYVGRFRLDELLEQKEEISQYVLEEMKKKQEDYCVEIVSAGIKDIILPGEIREIMNTVLLAEKRAQANVIIRREEVASTRSLLNTARLMDENQTLFKLKEMEYLERICDKVGTISLNGGKGVMEQLAELVWMERKEAGR